LEHVAIDVYFHVGEGKVAEYFYFACFYVVNIITFHITI